MRAVVAVSISSALLAAQAQHVAIAHTLARQSGMQPWCDTGWVQRTRGRAHDCCCQRACLEAYAVCDGRMPPCYRHRHTSKASLELHGCRLHLPPMTQPWPCASPSDGRTCTLEMRHLPDPEGMRPATASSTTDQRHPTSCLCFSGCPFARHAQSATDGSTCIYARLSS
jgi:hypothetical protein